MMKRGTRTLVRWSFGVACAGLQCLAVAQLPPPPASPPPAAAAQAAAPAATAGARFIESCNQSLERGVADLGCQGPIYRNELERLKREALSTQNPQLFSFVGDAYENPRSGLGDMGQAYRWYLLAAVRGDPRAMQRLTEMNRKGQGVPKDNVKALGYARLLQRIAQPDVGTPPHMLSLINELGAEMAVEEVALAERFAAELEARIQRQAAAGEGGDPGAQARPSAAAPGPGLPGMAVMPRANPVAPPSAPAALPGSTLPGMPGKTSP
ncbi:sel1 repeat family protein [Acidovorax sp.]|uniref:sel1 repeat family protein n=1 Tax=Acidovorax sp. TaxID=1872122 RepID=UPI002613A0FF|nr:sel1 repeat family protein [Acidovorax sp.]